MILPRIGRLAVKISVFSSLLIILVMASVLGMVIVTERKQVRGDITQNAVAYSQLTFDAFHQTYLTNYARPQRDDFTAFRTEVTDLLAKNTDVKNVEVLSISGRILNDSDEALSGKKYQGELRRITDTSLLKLLKQDYASQRMVTDSHGKTWLEILQPVPEASGSPVFVVRYLVSFDSLEARINTIYKDSLFIALPLLPVAIALAIVFSIPITRPIVRLTRATKRLSSGDYNLDVPVGASDEIGQLTTSFSAMVADIRSSRQTIEDQNRQLLREKARLDASINSLVLGYIMTDTADNIVVINQAAKIILARTPAEPGLLEDKSYTLDTIQQRLLPAIDLRAHIATCRAEGKTFTVEELSWEGRFLRIFIGPIVINAKENAGVVILIEDITEIKIVQHSKDEFLAIASHELRTPLTIITGNLSLIGTYHKEALKDPALNKCITSATQASNRMVELVNEFLDVSSLEQGRVLFENKPFDISALAKQTVEANRVLYPDTAVRLSLELPDTPIQALGDARHTGEVLTTLIENAYGVTEQGSITLRIGLEDGHVHVQVSDTGPGIPKDLQSLLFHKFQQARADIMTMSSTSGTGLGLYIARLIVERMGGKISLEWSEPGKGTRFGFTIPQASDNPPQETGKQ